MKHVAVLCGGRGTRLGYDGQKCLVPVAGRPFLHHKLDGLVRQGATTLHLLVAHRADDVIWAVGHNWWGVPVRYHHDGGINPTYAHHSADLPYFHWLTYGDSILDVPLVRRPWPYILTNDEFLTDAGLRFCFGRSNFYVPRWTSTEAFHCNSPSDLERASANLHR